MEEISASEIYLKDTAFDKLMQRRIFNVLLLASRYDAFMMEEDGRVDEQLYNEYVSLNLSSPPRVTRVSTTEAALAAMKNNHYDIVIVVPGADISASIRDCNFIKQSYPSTPIVVLTPFSKEVTQRIGRENLSNIDYVFSWLGNMDLLLAIIKLIEDKMNADDITNIGVQTILVVEDSVRFYSSILPHIYKFLLTQSRAFSTEALNNHERMLRMRGRPKVMLARSYEEAIDLYNKYGDNMLGVISDVSFQKDGQKDSLAGIKLATEIRRRDPFIPIIIESSETENAKLTSAFGGIFLDKNSKTLPLDLGDAIFTNFGFGDFIIRDPKTGQEITRISHLKDLQKKIFEIPAESLFYHTSRNDFSRWLYSRAIFPLAEIIKQHRTHSPDEADDVRQLFFNLIVKYRRMKNRGVVAVFLRDRFDRYSNFARIGQGSLGGKGRGLAFIDSIIKLNPICDNFYGATISIPRTVVICTDIFDEFMAVNKLYKFALSDAPDHKILESFLKAKLPEKVKDDIYSILDVIDKPLAVRSSSLLEDSHYQPFAGIYSTYMIPAFADKQKRLRMLVEAIKGVYASVFYRAAKSYMTATSNLIDQEKMAVIIQEVVGQQHGDYYFPSFSGVARSLNYYPLANEKPEDGVAEIAVGLGKNVVDGGTSLRFCPLHPEHVLQTSTLDTALTQTQTTICALATSPDANTDLSIDDSFNIATVSVQEFAGKGPLRNMVSTYNMADGYLNDFDGGNGRRIVTFANVLRDKVFPLAPAIDFMLKNGQAAMQRPIEIEFAGNISPNASHSPDKGHIYWLQIRPIIDRKEFVTDAIINEFREEDIILKSSTAIGNGNIDNIRTIIYIKPESFDSANNQSLVSIIGNLNRRLIDEGENYILVGPGRWGSSDHSLGIPVRWEDISAARVIAEMSLPNYRIEPSQGTHFFHNITSFGVSYLTINAENNDIFHFDRLDSVNAIYDDGLVRMVRFEHPLAIAVNGRNGIGIVATGKPSENSNNNIEQ